MRTVAGLAALLAAGAIGAGSGQADEAVTSGSASASRPPAGITLALTGDIGLNASLERVRPDGAMRHGTLRPWGELTSGIAADLAADLVFGNMETVVTDRNDLSTEPKTFNFRTHPIGVRHLVERGFNLFSTANNHAIDYRLAGQLETLAHLDALQGHGLKAHAGIGRNRQDAATPRRIETAGGPVLLSAIGIGGGMAGETRPGQLHWNSRQDLAEALSRLGAAPASYRMLSVHYGAELSVAPTTGDIARLRDEAVAGAGIDLVIGHHQHVANGIQQVGSKLIFYGLGNFLHLGTQDMSAHGLCRDYGMLARVHLTPGADGRLVARAVEVIPVVGTHLAPRRPPVEQATARIHVLNHLAAGLDAPQADARGLRLTPQADGRGLFCVPGAETEPGPIGALCRGFTPPAPPPDSLRSQIAASCGRSVLLARHGDRRDTVARTSARARASEPSAAGFFASVFGF